MDALRENPYRTLGLFGNATEKEVQKQIATIKRYAEVGKNKEFDYDFPFLGEVVRSSDKVKEAASKIEQAKNRVNYALFWFINKSHIDEAALNNLKEGNVEKAIEIWEKTLKSSSITEKNFSAASNLSTLYLASTLSNGSFDYEKFSNSIDLKGKLLTGEALNSFMSSVAGEDFSVSQDTIIKAFVDEVLHIVNPYLLKPVEKSGIVKGVGVTGIGLYRWENGDVYFGEWIGGKRSGFGLYLWGSGHYFSGHFESGVIHGEGIYMFSDGSKNIGVWENGKFQNTMTYDTASIISRIKIKFESIHLESGINFNNLSIVQFINAFRSFPPEIRRYISNKFTEKPISSIENQIDDCSRKRQIDPSEAAKCAEELIIKTRYDLIQIKNVVGEKNVQYQVLSNKLAEEILECSIDFYNKWQDSSSYDPGERALKIIGLAKSLNPTGQVKSRIEKNEGSIQEWVDDKPDRDKQRIISEDVKFIISKLNLAVETLNKKGRYPNGYDDPYSKLPLSQQPQNSLSLDLPAILLESYDFNVNLFRLARDIVNECRPKLTEINGVDKTIYAKLSNDVASISMACLIAYVNNKVNAAYGINPTINDHEIKAMNAIGDLEMVPEQRTRYNQQKIALDNLFRASNASKTSSSTNSGGGSGCYIATMAYGSYNHPQVIELRHFRDRTLSNSLLGRLFISFYYRISPKLVELLKNQRLINSGIRTLLNGIIRLIK